MKIISLTLLQIFFTINLYCDTNWIQIESINKTNLKKPNTKLDIDLSQIKPINKMIQNATLIKQLLEATQTKEKPTTNTKYWFVLNNGKIK